MKTPEGVYFVVRKRTEQLDFEEYGGEAYILDYPNPVDRLRGKTGSGIWVHSRGRAITPFESRGCVVLNLKDIAEVGPELKRGTPVLIGERVEIAPRKDAVHEVEERTRGWRAAWRRGEAGDGFIAPERAASIRKVERQESVYGSHSGLSGLWKGRGMWSRGLPSARLRPTEARRRGYAASIGRNKATANTASSEWHGPTSVFGL